MPCGRVPTPRGTCRVAPDVGSGHARHSHRTGGIDPTARIDYDSELIAAEDVDGTPLAAVARWYDAAVADERVVEPGAMVVATVDASGAPNARTVLLKGLDARGLVFFTGTTSTKGEELAAHPQASVVLLWHPMYRQVRVRGEVEQVSREDAHPLLHLAPARLAGRGVGLGAVAAARDAATTWSPRSRRSRSGSPDETRCRCPTSGVATACDRSRSSCGRGSATGCTTGGCGRPRTADPRRSTTSARGGGRGASPDLAGSSVSCGRAGACGGTPRPRPTPADPARAPARRRPPGRRAPRGPRRAPRRTTPAAGPRRRRRDRRAPQPRGAASRQPPPADQGAGQQEQTGAGERQEGREQQHLAGRRAPASRSARTTPTRRPARAITPTTNSVPLQVKPGSVETVRIQTRARHPQPGAEQRTGGGSAQHLPQHRAHQVTGRQARRGPARPAASVGSWWMTTER